MLASSNVDIPTKSTETLMNQNVPPFVLSFLFSLFYLPLFPWREIETKKEKKIVVHKVTFSDSSKVSLHNIK